MKRIFLTILLVALSGTAHALDADFLGYFRGGTGLNLEGGQRECFYNQGIPGNFLRLGNECDFYTELAFVFHHKKATADDPVFFKTQLRYAYSSKGLRQRESYIYTVPQTIPADGFTIKVPNSEIEAYVKAGGFSEVPGEFWVGKRFYRDVDMYISDWYYYGDMSGVGGGIEAIPVGPGMLAVAHLIQANEDIGDTSVGRPAMNALDIRYTSIPVFLEQKINFWGVYAWAPGSSADINGTPTEFIPTNGYVIGTKLEGKALNGFNRTALMFGQGIMKDFGIYGNSAVNTIDLDQTAQNHAWNVRLVEDYTHDVTDKWGYLIGFAANYGSNGHDDNNKVFWTEIGVRPIYYVSDRFQWVLETGYSRYEDEQEANGARELSRIAIAPQLSFSKSIWGRPVLRAFLAYSFWNDANIDKVAANAPTFANKNEGMSFGYQFESWF